MIKLELDGYKYGPIRALLDTGSQVNLMSYQFKRKHHLSTTNVSRKIVGIDNAELLISRKVDGKVCTWFESDVAIEESFLVLPKECDWHPILPLKAVNQRNNSSVTTLADFEYWKPRETDILLGVKFVAKILMKVISCGLEDTKLLETMFGTVILGADEGTIDKETGGIVSTIKCISNEDLNNLLKQLWELDQVGSSATRTDEQEIVEQNFMQTYSRDVTGRFIVTIPLKSEGIEIGNSRDIALRRFLWIEKRLEKEPALKEKYVEFMREYIKLGHMTRATKEPLPGELVYYIPHHCVTSKFRVVFDGGCRTEKGISLNDIQLLGEKLQRDLHEITMRFRQHPIVFVADIKQMFRQVRIHKSQWNLQRIFWRESSKEPLKEFWLTVVTYGLTSSAHNSVRAVIQCAREAKDRYPVAVKVIENDLYMDDCCSGANSKEEAIQLAKEIDIVLKEGGFELRKWKSNCKDLVQEMRSDRESSMTFEDEERTSILGLKWLTQEDKFTFTVKTLKLEGKITKRKIVSCVAQLYDPNGFLSPVVVRGKILIQHLWRLSLDWDEQVPMQIENDWKEFWRDIILLESFKMNRWIGTGNKTKTEIHGFSDASTVAYGAVIYVRVEYEDGHVKTNLLVSKTRVAPIKTVSVPRLELAAAELLSRLWIDVAKTMEWIDTSYTLWTDSTVVLQWMRKLPCNLKTFIANRVSSIQTNTEINKWRHVGTKDNPADLLSRGLEPKELVDNQLWLHGPSWLILSQNEWPVDRLVRDRIEEVQSELKVFNVTRFSEPLQITTKERTRIDLIEYTSTLERAINIISYILRFIGKLKLAVKNGNRKRTKRSTRNREDLLQLTLEEKSEALNYLIRKEQQKYFNKEITSIKKNNQVQEHSKIEPLKPILDRENLIRVGGRLDRAEIEYEMRHQAIIPKRSRLAYLLIDNAHRMTKHGAVQVMTQYIRQKFWIPQIRCELRNYLHKCVVCVRYNYQLENQLMADLPGDRIRTGKPFLCTGTDYAGPFEMKVIDRIGHQILKQKCWIVIFVCLKTRAIHIDLVTNQSSIAFIACYERFIGRRGRCEKIYSDNGTTFIGAKNEIQKRLELWRDKEFLDHINLKGTEWKFMIPAAPHQGGIYEAAVKSMKYHLKRVIGQKVLTYEQYITLLVGIEAILNSRPLYPLSDDPSDIQALTPGHFLIGEPLVLPPPFDYENVPAHKDTKLWKEKQKMLNHFWDRWKEEYLTTLQERKKWRREKEKLKIGQLVLLKAENFPPAQWAMGRIEELITSRDGIVRSVTVQTPTNRLTRPVQKICILPIEPVNDSRGSNSQSNEL